MATTRFLLQGKSEKTPIYLRFSVSRGNTPKRKTGLHIDPINWSEKSHLPKQNTAQNKQIRSKLQKLDSYVFDHYNEDYSNGVVIDGSWLEDQIGNFFKQGKNNKDLNIVTEYIQKYIDGADKKQNSKGGVGLSKSRIYDYKLLQGIIMKFQGKKTLLIKNIDLNFRTDFLDWMVDENSYSKGYAGRMLGTLKTICLDAQLHGIETHPQLTKVSGFKDKNNYVIYFSEDELAQIKACKLKNDYLLNARKWLLLGCYIGQRGGDLLNIDEDNFTVRNGIEVIELEQQKTSKNVAIPVLPEAKEIISDGLPRKISLQKFNTYIKEVCEIAGLDEKVRGKKLNPETNRHEEKLYPKWELVASHICRRTFATNHFGKIPTPFIMQITAHSNEKTFYKYIGKNSYDYAQQIAEYYAKEMRKKNHDSQMTVLKKAANI